jgi:hypothetical protein
MSERRGIIGQLHSLWHWSNEYPNGRLAAFAVASPLILMGLLAGIEGVHIAIVGHTFSEQIAVIGMIVFAIVANVAWFIILPIACFLTLRDYRRQMATHSTPSRESPD